MNVIKEPEEFSFDKVGIKGKIFQTSQLVQRAQFVLVETQLGHQTTIVEYASDFIYFVITGTGYFIVNDSKEKCTQGDLIVIPAGTQFTYKGKLKMLLVCMPPWEAEQEETRRRI